MTQKLTNKCDTMMFVGYSLTHGSNYFKMDNIKTNMLVISLDITWININYGIWITKKDDDNTHNHYYILSDDPEEFHISNEITEQDIIVNNN